MTSGSRTRLDQPRRGRPSGGRDRGRRSTCLWIDLTWDLPTATSCLYETSTLLVAKWHEKVDMVHAPHPASCRAAERRPTQDGGIMRPRPLRAGLPKLSIRSSRSRGPMRSVRTPHPRARRRRRPGPERICGRRRLNNHHSARNASSNARGDRHQQADDRRRSVLDAVARLARTQTHTERRFSWRRGGEERRRLVAHLSDASWPSVVVEGEEMRGGRDNHAAGSRESPLRTMSHIRHFADSSGVGSRTCHLDPLAPRRWSRSRRTRTTPRRRGLLSPPGSPRRLT